MKYDELAFFNQQLASMLKSGIPLEGSLRQLAASLKRGKFQQEMAALEKDLAAGLPLRDAVPRRQLPELYGRILVLGGESGELPVLLILLADYYERAEVLWTRLKGILIYPAIVLLVALSISLTLAYNFRTIRASLIGLLEGTGFTQGTFWQLGYYATLLPLSLMIAIGLALLAVLSIPPLRHFFNWHFPAFKEASLWRFAAAAKVLFRSGQDPDAVLAMLEQLEKGSPAGRDLTLWRQQLALGEKRFVEVGADDSVFPPLFRWLLVQSGEDLPGGFAQAADLYFNRATYRSEVLLQAVLPILILLFGFLILLQVVPILNFLNVFIQALGTP